MRCVHSQREGAPDSTAAVTPKKIFPSACVIFTKLLKFSRKYGIIKAWKNIDGAVGNTNVCRVNNGLQPINKRLKEQLIVTAMKKDDFKPHLR